MNEIAGWETYKEALEKGLSEMLPLCPEDYKDGWAPRHLTESMRYSLLGGGKRLRGTLLLAAVDMLEGDPVEAMPFALAVEMIHAYSLIHDDLPAMDDDDMRRGKPTNHRVYGEGLAVLSGDGLLNLAHEIMVEACAYGHTPRRLLRAMLEISRAAGVTGMIAGQCVDLDSEGKPADRETLAYIHAHKTGALITAPLVAAGHLCDAYQVEMEALSRFGAALGLAFQITDDLLDVRGDAGLMGKATGMDAQRGKMTFPAIYGVEESQRMATEQTEKAMESLSEFGGRAAFLRALCGAVLQRNL